MSLEILRPDGTHITFHDDDTISYTKHTLSKCDGCENLKPSHTGVNYYANDRDEIILWLCEQCVELNSGKPTP